MLDEHGVYKRHRDEIKTSQENLDLSIRNQMKILYSIVSSHIPVFPQLISYLIEWLLTVNEDTNKRISVIHWIIFRIGFDRDVIRSDRYA